MDSKINTKGDYANPEKEQQVYLAIGFTEKANKICHVSQHLGAFLLYLGISRMFYFGKIYRLKPI